MLWPILKLAGCALNAFTARCRVPEIDHKRDNDGVGGQTILFSPSTKHISNSQIKMFSTEQGAVLSRVHYTPRARVRHVIRPLSACERSTHEREC